MPQNQDNWEREGEGHPWRNGALSVVVVGAIVAAAYFSGHSSAPQGSGVEPSAAPAAEVHDRIRVKRIEIVDEAGKTVGVLQGVDLNKDAFAVLELVGHGRWAGQMVHIDPRQVTIVGEGGYAEVLATSAEWAATMPSGDADVKVRIGAAPDGGSVHVKSSASTPNREEQQDWSRK
jgi:hypothetical protein